jgi:gamma-glutamyltranspeptidase/glutathione hydrolase
MLHERYGTIPFGQLLQPAIRLAKDGFKINATIRFIIALIRKELSKFPKTASIYLTPEGDPLPPGTVLKQPELAKSLEIVAAEGAAAMYGGSLGDRIARAVSKAGGLLTARDFVEHRVEWIEPIRTTYRGYEVVTIPPNSQGLALLQMLNIMEGYDSGSFDRGSAELTHLQVEAKKLAFEDRNTLVCDPEFYDIPTTDLSSKNYAENLRSRIDTQKAFDPGHSSFPGAGDTTYFCIVDNEGNSISFINSLFHSFGSCFTAGDTGIILQNRGSGFSFNSEHPNSLQPHKRPLHTLVPCMVLKDSSPYLVIGCIGGDQQPQGLLQILMNIIDYGMSPQEAIDAPRWRSYEGKRLAIERAMGPKVVQSLSGKGHVISEEMDFFGGSQCIMFGADQTLEGGSDPRLAGCWQGLPQD